MVLWGSITDDGAADASSAEAVANYRLEHGS